MILKKKKQIEKWLDSRGIKNYTLNSDLTVDVHQDVCLPNESLKPLKSIPIQFGTVTGDFLCFFNQLKSLKGSPHTVHGNFYCGDNQLKSLKYSPISVGKVFECSNTSLTNLDFAPQYVGYDFVCRLNNIHNLKNFKTKIERNFIIDDKYMPKELKKHIVRKEGDDLSTSQLSINSKLLKTIILNEQINKLLVSKENDKKSRIKI